MELEDVFVLVVKEYRYTTENFLPMQSAHEGLAIIREEYKELEEEVFKKQDIRSIHKMNAEAIQIATMAIRFVINSRTWIDWKDDV